MKQDNRPNFKPGQKLTLANSHWRAHQGGKVEFVSCRKDQQCKSGFRVKVMLAGKLDGLDAGWFTEYAEQLKQSQPQG